MSQLEAQDGEKKDLILRDYLAIDRTKLANSRTLLAYLRTAMVMALSGITLIELLAEFKILHYLGYALIPMSFIVLALGLFQYFVVQRKVKNRYYKF